MLTEAQRRFLGAQRVARFASSDAAGQPHVLPVCYAVSGESIYFSIDEKPKRVGARRLKRMRNIARNPRVALVVDRYEEDWARLGWVMVQGRAEVLAAGDEHAAAQAALRVRYPQYLSMRIEELPVVAIRIEDVKSWGDLATA
jgi:PPOX class probable F420-dependent enzyme